MAETGIFPPKDADFNDYFGNAAPYLVNHSGRFLITATNLTQLNTFITNWAPLYSASQNANTATKTIIENKNIMRNDIEALLRTIYDDIPNSVLTTDDRNTLNLHQRQPNTPRPAITTKPNVILRAQEGFRMLVENRVLADSSRASKHEHCDVVEYRYKITDVAAPAPAPPSPGTPSTPAAAVWIGPKLSGKARFIIQLAETDAGKLLTLQSRWKNTVDDNKSGPWSDEVSARIIW